MKRLMGTGQYKLDAQGKNPELEKAVRQQTYGTSKPTFRSQYGLDELEKQIDEQMGAYEQRQANQGNRANYYEKQLREKMPWLGADEQKLQKQYANIKDPFAREKVIQQGMDLGRTSLGEMMNRMMGVYQSKTAEQEAGLRGTERKYARALEKYERDQAENDRLAQLEAQQMAMMSAGGGGGRSSGGGRRSSGGGRYSKASSGYGSTGQEAAGANPDIQSILEQAQSRGITREQAGQQIADLTGENLDDVMKDIYETYLPDEALQGVDVGGQILPEEQAGKYQQVQEAAAKPKSNVWGTIKELPGVVRDAFMLPNTAKKWLQNR